MTPKDKKLIAASIADVVRAVDEGCALLSTHPVDPKWMDDIKSHLMRARAIADAMGRLPGCAEETAQVRRALGRIECAITTAGVLQ